MNKQIVYIVLCLCMFCTSAKAIDFGPQPLYNTRPAVVTKMVSSSYYVSTSSAEPSIGYTNEVFEDRMSASFASVLNEQRSIQTSFSTIANSIVAGTCIYDEAVEEAVNSASRRAPRTPGVPDVKTPIGNGGDVLLLLFLLAMTYSLTRNLRSKKTRA